MGGVIMLGLLCLLGAMVWVLYRVDRYEERMRRREQEGRE